MGHVMRVGGWGLVGTREERVVGVDGRRRGRPMEVEGMRQKTNSWNLEIE